MAKILVADDEVDQELLIKQRFRRQIRENKFEFIFALNGEQALHQLQQHPDTEVILTDINMPVMDGLTLLTRLPEVSPLVKAVMVSAYGDMDNIRTAMNRGAFDFVCKPINFEDLEVTIEKTLRYVGQLKETLQAIKENNILRMYVDESVLKFISRKEFASTLLVNETIEGTVVFINLCNFTTIVETVPAENVVTLLNQHLDLMAKEIINQKGYIDKFMGDVMMAVFKGEYHLDRAVEAALSVRAQVANFPAQSNGLNFSPKVSIGIHSGEMVSGNIGSVNLKRLDYTVIGDTVNTAERLQGAAETGQVLLTEASYQKIKEYFNCERVGEIRVKNKAQPLVVYNVIS